MKPFKNMAYNIGLLHDIGKYQEGFQKRIRGENIRIDHSTCAAKEFYSIENYKIYASMLASCTAGHHSGIPNYGYPTDSNIDSSLCGRLKKDSQDYSFYKNELKLKRINYKELHKFFCQENQNEKEMFHKVNFFTKYLFSVLVDSDSIDTAKSLGTFKDNKLRSKFKRCKKILDNHMNSFTATTNLQKARSLIQNQVYENKENGDIFLLNMPTGSGKTLCSIKFALDNIERLNCKKIIYVIPFNSIIDQTAEIFSNLFKDNAEILRHQSTFSYDDHEEIKYKIRAKNSSENWNADFIITTANQFFESIHSNKRSRLRKFHNMENSLIIFDEVHTMPIDYLQPCLESISYLTKYLNCKALFLTATMPDFESVFRQYVDDNTKIVNLIKDTSLFHLFKKCSYRYFESLNILEIILAAHKNPSSLIVVNNKATAKLMYDTIKSDHKYCLSTYETHFDILNTINKIKKDLSELEKEYSNEADIPEERKIIVISTSLIEAGVDLDFRTVFREKAGLDSILQAGGRCNREGKHKDAVTYIFSLDKELHGELKVKAAISNHIYNEFSDISDNDAIIEYYYRLFLYRKEDIASHDLDNYSYSNKYCFRYADYSKDFKLIEDKTCGIVILEDNKSRDLISELETTGFTNFKAIQQYMCSVSLKEFETLIKNNLIKNVDSEIYYLTDNDYYSSKTGIQLEKIRKE